MKDDFNSTDNSSQSQYEDNGNLNTGQTKISKPIQPDQPVAIGISAAKPVVAYVILGITVLIYILQYWTQYQYNLDIPFVIGGKVNELIIQGQFWRLITPILLHGGILHLGFNMYALYVIGTGLELYYGHGRFLILYLLAGFAGNVMSFLFTPENSLGSSTAIFGLLGAQGMFMYQNRGIFGRRAQSVLFNLILIAGINLVIGLSPGIDNWGHIGGLIAGSLFAMNAGPLLKIVGEYPNLILIDSRTNKEIVRAAISVFLLFGLLAAVTIYLRL